MRARLVGVVTSASGAAIWQNSGPTDRVAGGTARGDRGRHVTAEHEVDSAWRTRLHVSYARSTHARPVRHVAHRGAPISTTPLRHPAERRAPAGPRRPQRPR